MTITGLIIAGIFAAGATAWIAHAIREWWQEAGRKFSQAAADTCLWCHPSPAGRVTRCTCTSACPDVERCAARYERTNTAIGTIPPYREETPR